MLDLLILILLLSWLLSGQLIMFACALGPGLATGGLLLAHGVSLSAVWLLRHHCPPAVVRSMQFHSPWRSWLGWSLLCAVGAIGLSLLAAVALPGDPTQALVLGPVVARPAGFLAVAMAVPLLEEFLFRGLVLQALQSRIGSWPAVAASAAVFGAAHQSFSVGLFALSIGLLFGWAAVRSGSLWPGVAGHVAANVLGSVLLMLAPAGHDTPADRAAQMQCQKPPGG